MINKYITYYKSPISDILLSSDGQNITGLWFVGQKFFPDIKDCQINKNLDIFKTAALCLDKYFDGKNPDFEKLKILPQGSEFRLKVWKRLCKIPYGTIISYSDIAKNISIKKMSAQAVGGAVGHNPISVIIPCHRVVGKNGELTGYAAGLEIKQKLLQIEGINFTKNNGQYYLS